MLHIYPLFLFWFWYSSCFDVKCWFHTFRNQCSHISMGVLSFLIIKMVMLNSFNRCPFCSSQVVFVFPTLPPFFFLEPEILRWSIHFIHVMFLHSFPSMFLSGDLSWRCSRASSSSFFCSRILPVDVIQDFGVDLILFLISQCFLIPVHQLFISPLVIHIRSAEDS